MTVHAPDAALGASRFDLYVGIALGPPGSGDATDGRGGGCVSGRLRVLRVAITWMIGIWGMKQKGLWKKMPLIPLWDAMAFAIWLASFGRRTIRWRGVDYYIRARDARAGSGGRRA